MRRLSPTRFAAVLAARAERRRAAEPHEDDYTMLPVTSRRGMRRAIAEWRRELVDLDQLLTTAELEEQRRHDFEVRGYVGDGETARLLEVMSLDTGLLLRFTDGRTLVLGGVAHQLKRQLMLLLAGTGDVRLIAVDRPGPTYLFSMRPRSGSDLSLYAQRAALLPG